MSTAIETLEFGHHAINMPRAKATCGTVTGHCSKRPSGGLFRNLGGQLKHSTFATDSPKREQPRRKTCGASPDHADPAGNGAASPSQHERDYYHAGSILIILPIILAMQFPKRKQTLRYLGVPWERSRWPCGRGGADVNGDWWLACV